MKKISGFRTHAVALFVLLLIAVFYGLPEFKGKELLPHDHEMYLGGAWELIEHERETGEEALWLRSMFGGMPAYLLHFKPDNNWVGPYVQWALSLGLPRIAMYLWIGMAGFYLMLLAFRIKPVSALAGSAAFGLTTYISVILAAGHYGKVVAIMYMPWVIAGLALMMHKKYGWGLLVTTAMMSCEIMAGHYQMTYYYMVFVVALLGIAWAFEQLREKKIKPVIFTASLAGLAIAAGVFTNMNKILPVQEYQPYSTRGVSELASKVDPANQTGGLPRDYILGYSYAKGDLMALMIPNFKGPGNNILGNNAIARAAVKKSTDREMLQYFDAYWGNQDAAGGVIYAGILVTILAFMSLFTVRHWLVLPLTVGCVLTMLLALGKNLPGISNFFIDHFPAYNKFRAVNSIMVIPQFCIPFLFGLQLHQMSDDADFWSRPMGFLGKGLKTSVRNQKFVQIFMPVVAGLFLLFWMAPGMFQDFIKPDEMKMLANAGRSDLAEVVETARISIYRADALRSLIFLILGLALIGLLMKGKVQPMIFGIVVVALVVGDLFFVNMRYLPESKYQKLAACEKAQTGMFGWKSAAKLDYLACDAPKPRSADAAIKNMTAGDPAYRVLNLSVSTFNDATTSFYHASVGGYHGAKMKRYQELIENRLHSDINAMVNRAQNPGPDGIDLMNLFDGLAGLNMLNTRFVIADPEGNPIPNYSAYGAAWTAEQIVWAESADEEIQLVSVATDLRKVAVVNRKFANKLAGAETLDGTAEVQLKELRPDRVSYESRSKGNSLVVFSEIYYPKGWNAYIDGVPAEHVQANYVLRALMVPAGTHEIVFEFRPESVERGATMSLAGSLVSLVLIGAGLFWGLRKEGGEK